MNRTEPVDRHGMMIRETIKSAHTLPLIGAAGLDLRKCGRREALNTAEKFEQEAREAKNTRTMAGGSCPQARSV